jgi:glucokinase
VTAPGTDSTDRPLVCGLDLGGTKLLGVLLDPDDVDGGPLIEFRVPTPVGTDAVETAIIDVSRQLIDRAPAELGRQVRATGLGAPGLVDRSGTLRYGPNLPGVIDEPFGAKLSAGLGMPVVVDNDATCAAWGEHERGASRGRNHSVLIALGTGIGAGITVKGEVLRGANGFAGEPGHMVVDPTGPLCPCSRRGCWERYASGSGLARLGREVAAAGRSPRLVELAGGDPEQVRGEHVVAAANGGDAEALSVLERFGWWVALGIANIVNLLDPEIVVIGGGLVEAGTLLMDPIEAAYRDLVMAYDHRPVVDIVAAQLGEHAGAVGAALLAAQRT